MALLKIPPLAECRDDILPLARFFIERYQTNPYATDLKLSALAEKKLYQHAWPGNIRELENIIHYAVLVCDGAYIEPEHLTFSTMLQQAQYQAQHQPPIGMIDHAEAVLCMPNILNGIFQNISCFR